MDIKQHSMDEHEYKQVQSPLSSAGENGKEHAEHRRRLRSWSGYFFSIPVIGLAMLAMLLGQYLLPRFAFFEAPMFLAVIIIASVWGTGPALFAVLLGALSLDYFVLPPLDIYNVQTGKGLLELLPFLIAGMLVAVITSQREQARQRARHAEHAIQLYADELTRNNAQLEEANRMKTEYLSIASHELKTPITAILMHAQLLQRCLKRQPTTFPTPARFSEGLEKIEVQTGRMNALVDDLVDWSRIRSGKMELHLSQCDLATLCRDVVEEQRLVSGRVIELRIPQEPVPLSVDSNRIGQVVTNLVSNAVKYSPESAPVRVVVERNESEALLRVSDNGSGIPEEQRKHIFELFYRAPDAQNSVQLGLGLGLAICKEIVERHEGHIWCESVIGKGSTFVVSLPLR